MACSSNQILAICIAIVMCSAFALLTCAAISAKCKRHKTCHTVFEIIGLIIAIAAVLSTIITTIIYIVIKLRETYTIFM